MKMSFVSDETLENHIVRVTARTLNSDGSGLLGEIPPRTGRA